MKINEKGKKKKESMQERICSELKKECCRFFMESMGTDDMKYLAEGLKGNNVVTTVTITWCYIGLNADNMKYLAEGLKENNSITYLSLRINCIGKNVDNMKYLAEGLKGNNVLRILELNGNSIGSNDDNMQYLVEGLKGNNSVTRCHLSENNICNEWYKELEMIAKNKNRLLPLDCLAYEVLLKNNMNLIEDFIHLHDCMSDKLKRNKVRYDL